MSDDTQRMIGKLLESVDNLKTVVGNLSEQFDGFRSDYSERKGATKMLYTIVAAIGGASGAVGAYIKNIFLTGGVQ